MPARMESPKDEMKRKMRDIAGAASAGEKDEQLCAKARRRLNQGLDAEHQISERRARGYWQAEYETIPSVHMDRVRDLHAVLPIQEAIDAVESAERYLEKLATEGCFGLAERTVESVLRSLVDRVVAARNPDAGDHRDGAVRYGRRASDGERRRVAVPSTLPSGAAR